MGSRATGSCIGESGHGVARAAVWRVSGGLTEVLLLSSTSYG